eukprot:scaffold29130_cov107-Amphora_coffeaeformis.AAC.1
MKRTQTCTNCTTTKTRVVLPTAVNAQSIPDDNDNNMVQDHPGLWVTLTAVFLLGVVVALYVGCCCHSTTSSRGPLHDGHRRKTNPIVGR